MGKTTTGIEIKRDRIRILQLKKGLKEIFVLDYLEEKLPFVPALELEENINLIATKLKALFARLPVKVKNPVFIIPTSEIMVRFFDLPYLSKSERNEAIKYEAQKYIPFAIDDIVSDFYIPYEIRGKEMRVVFMAVKNEILTHYFNIVSSLGVKPLALEPYPFSLLRALFTSGDLKPKEFVLIIDLDYAGSTILVTQGLNLYIARDFIVPAAMEATSAQILNKITFEINRTIDYMIKEFPHQPIKGIILTGEIANEVTRDSLMSMLNMKVKLASLEGKITAEREEILRRYTGLLGAGLRGLISYDIDLDFFSDYQKKIGPESKLRLSDFLPRELIQDIVLIFLGVFMANLYLKYQINTIKEMKKSVSFMETEAIKNKGSLVTDITNIKERLLLYKSIFNSQMRFTNVLNFIPERMPSGIWLDKFFLTEKKDKRFALLIQGYGYKTTQRGIDLIYDFLENIHNSPEAKRLFQNINIVNMEKVQLGGFKVVKFTMSFLLK